MLPFASPVVFGEPRHPSLRTHSSVSAARPEALVLHRQPFLRPGDGMEAQSSSVASAALATLLLFGSFGDVRSRSLRSAGGANISPDQPRGPLQQRGRVVMLAAPKVLGGIGGGSRGSAQNRPRRAPNGERDGQRSPGDKAAPRRGWQQHKKRESNGKKYERDFRSPRQDNGQNLRVSRQVASKGQDAVVAESRARFFEAQARMPVEISPKDPKISPWLSYTESPLHPSLRAALRARRLEKPTPCQQWAAPYLIAGNDLMVCSQTGSGKTLAYLVPALQDLFVGLDDRRARASGSSTCPGAVVLAPTRELALQIVDEASMLLAASGSGVKVGVACLYGGVPYRETREALKKATQVSGACLIVATPGRLDDCCTRGDVSLKAVRTVVLDEADRMLDLGFEPQIRELLTRRGMPRVGSRRTAMFSATFGVGVQHLAADFMDAYTFVAVGRVGSAVASSVSHRLVWADEQDKPRVLLGALLGLEAALSIGEAGGVVVFVNTKDAARDLEHRLRKWRFNTFSIHGDKKQDARESALASFRSCLGHRGLGNRARRAAEENAGLAVLVATDVAARGLDIPDIGSVIQYDLPSRIDDFVHRAGRTGRLGRTGIAIGFANDKARRLSPDLIRTLSAAGARVPTWLEGMAISLGEDPKALYADAASYGAQDVRLSGAGIQTAEERAEAQKLRTFDQDAYAGTDSVRAGRATV